MLLSFNHWMPFLSSLNLFSSSQHPAAGSLSAPQSTGPMLRVLCLHGYHGSGPTLKSQMAGVAGTFAHNGYELVFADTPSLRAGDFGWWHSVTSPTSTQRGDPGVPGGGHHHRVTYKGWDRTREFIVDTFRAKGPFDGVFGFSQGAALTGLLVGLRAPDGKPTAQKPLVFNFAIEVSGFEAADENLAKLYDGSASFDLPSLHFIGDSDGIVPRARTDSLTSRFNPAKATILRHSGGHVIASGHAIISGLDEFLKARRKTAIPVPAPTFPRRSIVVPMWPGRSEPVMRVHFPALPTAQPSPAIVVLRGGAYATNAGSGGGTAQWAAKNGFIGVEVDYRIAGREGAYPGGYADAARAMRLTRANAEAWKLDANRVALLGYSAGGHLASLVSSQPSLHKDPDDDLASQIYPRPDLAILGYPVISFVDGYTGPRAFVGSIENFFGPRVVVDETARRAFSSELHVTNMHPPTFIWTTADDSLVPASHSEVYVEALKKAEVPVYFKMYPSGPHGMGLALDRHGEVAQWSSLLLKWMEEQWGKP